MSVKFYVYFITFEGKGNSPVKIGYSSDPDARMADLQTANPRKLKIALTIPFDSEPEAREAEKTMQRLAGKKHKRMSGEWFTVYGSWSKFIDEAMRLYDQNQKNKKAHNQKPSASVKALKSAGVKCTLDDVFPASK